MSRITTLFLVSLLLSVGFIPALVGNPSFTAKAFAAPAPQGNCQPTISVGNVVFKGNTPATSVSVNENYEVPVTFAKAPSACLKTAYNLKLDVRRIASSDTNTLINLTTNGPVPVQLRRNSLEAGPRSFSVTINAGVTPAIGSFQIVKSGQVGSAALSGSPLSVGECTPGLNITKVDYRGKSGGDDVFEVAGSVAPPTSGCTKIASTSLTVEAKRPLSKDNGTATVPASGSFTVQVRVRRGPLDRDPESFTATLKVTMAVAGIQQFTVQKSGNF